MNLESRQSFLSLIRLGIGHTGETLAALFDWKEIMSFAEKQGISAIVVNGIEQLPQEIRPPQSIMLEMIGLGLLVEQKARIQWNVIQELVDFFKLKEIITVGLKGKTVAQLYPHPFSRDSCDFDCFLLKNTEGRIEFVFEEGNKAVEALGMKVDRRIYVHSVFGYKGLTVENHHYLAAVKLSKRHRQLDKLLRSLLLEEPLMPVMDSDLMMGPPLFNAVFLMHHAHRHALNEFLPIKLLIDWALFIDNNASLDWKRFWFYSRDLGMLRFAQTITRATERLLGTKLPFELPIDLEADYMLDLCLWDIPNESKEIRSLFKRRLRIIPRLIRARKKYKVFYDSSSFSMIVAYVKGFLLGKEE